MKWKKPPKIKVYEALGSISDKRIEVKGNRARVYSSSGKKAYSVSYDGRNSIMSNDNGSCWRGYLGYPSIALLMVKGKIDYAKDVSEAFKDIKWKDINKKFKNNYSKTESHIF